MPEICTPGSCDFFQDQSKTTNPSSAHRHDIKVLEGPESSGAVCTGTLQLHPNKSCRCLATKSSNDDTSVRMCEVCVVNLQWIVMFLMACVIRCKQQAMSGRMIHSLITAFKRAQMSPRTQGVPSSTMPMDWASSVLWHEGRLNIENLCHRQKGFVRQHTRKAAVQKSPFYKIFAHLITDPAKII